jgi:DNA-binding response OmpR family regulator
MEVGGFLARAPGTQAVNLPTGAAIAKNCQDAMRLSMVQPPPVLAPRPRVLVVEDDQDLLRMMQRMLTAIADVTIASDGEEALKLLGAGTLPDLIITDWMMPRKDGLTLVRDMKLDERLKRVPVIILTAKTAPRDVIAGINSGVRHYLTKPFKPDELIAKVRKVLRL